jgi:hypothetical protein
LAWARSRGKEIPCWKGFYMAVEEAGDRAERKAKELTGQVEESLG